MVFSFQSLLTISNLVLATFLSNGLGVMGQGPNLKAVNFQPIKFSTGLKTIDFTKLPANQKFEISNKRILADRLITVPFPKAPVEVNKNFDDLSTAALKESLPTILSQFNVPADKLDGLVTKGIPLLNEAVIALFNGQSLSKSSPKLARRGILDDIIDWAGNILSDGACAVFAAGALPAYLTAAALFAIKNPGTGVRTSPDQDFFMFPLHGDIARSAPISLHFSASFPPGFGNAAGVTMGKSVYLIMPNSPNGSDPDFVGVTKLLLHELTHSVQYQADGWNLAAYGTEYLFDYCKAGFSYTGNVLEVEAYTKQEYLNQLLLDPFGRRFFLVWRGKPLRSALGLPTQQKYTEISSSPKFAELRFQNGMLQIKDACFRTFTNSEIQKRADASCKTKPLCKRDLVKRLQRIDGDGAPERPECDPEAEDQQNKKCKADKSAWAALDARPFDCSVSLPPLPPPALPGCPPNCQIMTVAPSTAKPCRSDNPPENCDAAFVRQNNADCRAERKRCGIA